MGWRKRFWFTSTLSSPIFSENLTMLLTRGSPAPLKRISWNTVKASTPTNVLCTRKINLKWSNCNRKWRAHSSKLQVPPQQSTESPQNVLIIWSPFLVSQFYKKMTSPTSDDDFQPPPSQSVPDVATRSRDWGRGGGSMHSVLTIFLYLNWWCTAWSGSVHELPSPFDQRRPCLTPKKQSKKTPHSIHHSTNSPKHECILNMKHHIKSNELHIPEEIDKLCRQLVGIRVVITGHWNAHRFWHTACTLQCWDGFRNILKHKNRTAYWAGLHWQIKELN